jgi:predicted transcriptional regulator
VARTSWFDDKAEHPVIQEQIQKLKAFTDALEDGVVTTQEVNRQEQRLISAMKQVDTELSDDLHAKVTALLVEMSAYNVMRLLHELQAERARMAFHNA